MLSKIKTSTLLAIIAILIPFSPSTAAMEQAARQDAFPGAEGFGRYSLGGRGGRVVKVTNLKDAGPGSLRAALREKGPRNVLFDVSGTIELESAITIKDNFVTIAGQSAPGDGITLKNHGLVVKASEIIIRYIRSRPGGNKGVEADAISVSAGKNIIIDHCSTSWGTDETLTVSPSDKFGLRTIDRVTIQWCMITEALNDSVHSKGKHGYGSLVRGSAGARYTFHHNLWAHHLARMPRPGNYVEAAKDPEGPLIDFRNNVFYNWGGAASGYNADTQSVSHYNFVSNYYLRGVNSSKGLAFDESNSLAEAHFSGNYMNHELPMNPWSLVRFEDGRTTGKEKAFPAAPVFTQPAKVAYENVLRRSGASLVRDSVDHRIIEQLRNGDGRIIDSVEEVGGWPQLESGTASADHDEDGMPDDWELARNLDPADATDGAKDGDGDGYTNLEDYLNSLVDDAE